MYSSKSALHLSGTNNLCGQWLYSGTLIASCETPLEIPLILRVLLAAHSQWTTHWDRDRPTTRHMILRTSKYRLDSSPHSSNRRHLAVTCRSTNNTWGHLVWTQRHKHSSILRSQSTSSRKIHNIVTRKYSILFSPQKVTQNEEIVIWSLIDVKFVI